MAIILPENDQPGQRLIAAEFTGSMIWPSGAN